MTENGDTWFIEKKKEEKKTGLAFWTESSYEKLSFPQINNSLFCFDNEKRKNQEKLSGQTVVLLVAIIWLATSPLWSTFL